MSSITGGDAVSLELSSQEIAAPQEDTSIILNPRQNVRSPKRVALRAALIKHRSKRRVPLFRAHKMPVIVANFSGVILVEESGEVLEIGNVSTGPEKGART